MKRFLFVLLMCIGVNTISVSGQEKIAFSKVMKVDSVNADGIFVSIKEWLSMEFKKGNNSIELEDKEAGLIVANASMPYKYTGGGINYAWATGTVDFKINLQIRDNRFKVTITNFLLKCPNKGGEKMGMLTTAKESNYTAWGKKIYNNVWDDLKLASIVMADSWFKLFETVDFSNYKKDTSEDW